MKAYKIQRPHMIPKIAWACRSRVTKYDWKNKNSIDMIEFSVCNASERTVVAANGSPETLKGKGFSCIAGDESYRSCAEDGVAVEIVSVAASFGMLSFEKVELCDEDIKDESVLLLPCLHTELPAQILSHFEALLYRIIESYKEHHAAADMLCGSILLSLIFELDRMMRRAIKTQKDKYVHYYVDKAESILLCRYAQGLTVKGVAEELSITPNYLSAIFKTVKGIGFTDRLLEIRMQKAAALLEENRLSISEIAEAVGYEEIGGFRRRFKQYFGIGIRDYLCIRKEITLYHAKPERKTE